MPTTVAKDELLEMAGHESGPTPWFRIDQERINQFAEATRDHQFIHVDEERARATPFGGTIAHGFLTLSLLPHLAKSVAVVPAGLQMAINYGLDKVRFPRPVPVGSEIRLRSTILDVSERKSGQILVKTETRIEIRGESRPALVAETLTLFVME